MTAAYVPRWRIAEKRKLPTPTIARAMFNSPVSSSSWMRLSGSTSASRALGASGGRSWLFIGTHCPLILISAGACADRYTSDAFFSPISRWILSIVPLMSARQSRLLIAQQIVQRRLRAGLRVHALDDHRTVQAVLAVVTGQVARNHHRPRRDAAISHGACGAIVNLRALADVPAHRNHGVFLDVDAFLLLRPGAVEAVVLDDRRVGLQRLQLAPQAHTAGQVHV